MSKCQNCGVTILDATEKCPLCRCIVEPDGTEGKITYPDAWLVAKRFHLFENIVLFLSLLCEAVLAYINYMTMPHFAWSAIVGLILIYANVVLRLAIIGKSGYMFKTLCLLFIAIVILIAIDYMTGYRKWSLNYVMPSGVLLMDIGILVLMIVNKRNWQSYMPVQLTTIALSVIPALLAAAGVTTITFMIVLSIAFSVFLFLGTLIIGDERAKTELRRRFHI